MTVYAEEIFIEKSEASGLSRYTAQDYNEILLVSEGRGVFSSGENDFPIGTGSILLITPECKYSIVTDGICRLISVSGSFERPFLFDEIKHVRDNIYGEGKKLAELILYNRFGNDGYLGRLCDAYVEYISMNIDLEPKNTTAAIYKIIGKMEKNFRLRSKDAELEKLPGGRAAPYEEKGLCPHRVVRTWSIWNFLCGHHRSSGLRRSQCG